MYFKPREGLPNPKGPLSLSIPSQVIALANNDHESCGVPSHIPAFRQWLPPILLDKNNVVALNTAGSFELLHVSLSPTDYYMYTF